MAWRGPREGGALVENAESFAAPEEDHMAFDSAGQAGSVRIVQHVMRGKVRASVSMDGIKSTYNHLRYRLTRPRGQGGLDMAEPEAERLAREHIARTFYGGGAWRVITAASRDLKALIAEGTGELSLEDALEFQAYQSARAATAGPTMFVTRDKDFPEGVHPHHLAREHGWL